MRTRIVVAGALALCGACRHGGSGRQAATQPAVATDRFATEVRPLLLRYCSHCHGSGKHEGGVILDRFPDESAAKRERALWQVVLARLGGREMPPAGEQQPTDAERARILTWVESSPLACSPSVKEPGRGEVRTLSRSEWARSAADLLRVDPGAEAELPAEGSKEGIDLEADPPTLSPALAAPYRRAAARALDAALAPPAGRAPRGHLFFRLPAPGTERETAHEILRHFTTRAYRRPTADADIAPLLVTAESAWAAGATFDRGVRVALEAMLSAPHFLVRTDLGPPRGEGVQAISELALASRLAFFVWGSIPDETLIEAAAAGTLRRNVRAHLRTMLADPRAGALLGRPATTDHLAETLLAEAIGRPVGLADRCAVGEVTAAARRGGIRAAVEAVVATVPFQMSEAESPPLAE